MSNGWWVLVLAFIMFVVAVIGGMVKDFWHSAFFPALLVYVIVGLILPPIFIPLGILVVLWLLLAGGGQGFFNWIQTITRSKAG